VSRGELVCLLAPTAPARAPRSDDLRLVRPSRGRVVFDGEEIGGLGPAEIVRRGIAHCPEGRRVFPHLTVEKTSGSAPGSGGTRRSAPTWTGRFSYFRSSPRAGGSRGARSPAASSRCSRSGGAHVASRLILFDEPSLGLAPAAVEATFGVIRAVRAQGTTVLMVGRTPTARSAWRTGLRVGDGRIALAGRRATCSTTRTSGAPTSGAEREMGARYVGAAVARVRTRATCAARPLRRRHQAPRPAPRRLPALAPRARPHSPGRPRARGRHARRRPVFTFRRPRALHESRSPSSAPPRPGSPSASASRSGRRSSTRWAGASSVTRRRSSRWSWPTAAPAPRTPPTRSRSSGSRCGGGRDGGRRPAGIDASLPGLADNVAVGFTHAIGDADAAFDAADVVLEERFRIQRYVGMPIEPRGVVAAFDQRDGTLTTWNSTQVPHFVQAGARHAARLPPGRIRVVAPRRRGGFGTRPRATRRTRSNPDRRPRARPARKVERGIDASTFDGRGHARHRCSEIALGRAPRRGDPRRPRITSGSTSEPTGGWGIVLPYNTVATSSGPTASATCRWRSRRSSPTRPPAPVPRAGSPEAVFAMDRAVDCLARRSAGPGGDPSAELPGRGTSFRGPRELPYPRRQPARLRQRRFPSALGGAGRRGLRRVQGAQNASRARNLPGDRDLGLRRRDGDRALRGRHRQARPRRPRQGRHGAASAGRATRPVRQVAADALGVPLDWVTVWARHRRGGLPAGHFASRSAVTAAA